MGNTQIIIDALEAKKAAINKELELLDDKKASQLKAKKILKENSEKKQSRKNENRKKFIVGAVVLKEMQRNPNFKNQMWEFLKGNVTSNRDRLVIGLDD